MADFIDAFDHEHSLLGAILFRREARRDRTSGAEYSLWNPATRSERTDREARGVTRRETFSATTIRAFAYRLGTVRVYQTILRQHRHHRRKIAPEQFASLAHRRPGNRAARLP